MSTYYPACCPLPRTRVCHGLTACLRHTTSRLASLLCCIRNSPQNQVPTVAMSELSERATLPVDQLGRPAHAKPRFKAEHPVTAQQVKHDAARRRARALLAQFCTPYAKHHINQHIAILSCYCKDPSAAPLRLKDPHSLNELVEAVHHIARWTNDGLARLIAQHCEQQLQACLAQSDSSGILSKVQTVECLHHILALQKRLSLGTQV